MLWQPRIPETNNVPRQELPHAHRHALQHALQHAHQPLGQFQLIILSATTKICSSMNTTNLYRTTNFWPKLHPQHPANFSNLKCVVGNFSVNEAIGVRAIVTKFSFLSSTIPVYSPLVRLAEIWSPIHGTVACRLAKSELRRIMQPWAVAVPFVSPRGLAMDTLQIIDSTSKQNDAIPSQWGGRAV